MGFETVLRYNRNLFWGGIMTAVFLLIKSRGRLDRWVGNGSCWTSTWLGASAEEKGVFSPINWGLDKVAVDSGLT